MSSSANSGGRRRTSTPSAAQSQCQRDFRPDLAHSGGNRRGKRDPDEPPVWRFLPRHRRPITVPSHHRPVSHLCYRSLTEFSTGAVDLVRIGPVPGRRAHCLAGSLSGRLIVWWAHCLVGSLSGRLATWGWRLAVRRASVHGLRPTAYCLLPTACCLILPAGLLDTDGQGGYDWGLPSFQKHPQGTVRCVRLRRVRTRLRDSGT
jgi:hypothetical protein